MDVARTFKYGGIAMSLKSLKSMLFTIMLLLAPAYAGAAIPGTVNYQGRVTDNAGTPLQGSHAVTLTLYNSGGTQVWTETHPTVTVTDGLFSLEMGSVTAFGPLAFDVSYTLGIAVDGGAELTPRQPLSSVPYALMAQKVAAGSIDAAAIAAGAVDSNAIADGSVALADLAQGTCTANQMMQWDGVANAWTCVTPNYVLKSGETMTGALIISGVTAGSKLIMTGGGIVNSTSAQPVWNAVTGKYEPSVAGAIPAIGSGVRMMWYPEMAAFRAGYVDGTQWNDANVGGYSTAMGNSTTASGDSSTAMGSYATAGGAISTAMGLRTNASGNNSTALGDHATASAVSSTAMGAYTTASGNYSTAMGSNTTASFIYSTAMGLNTTASATSATAMGSNTTASGGSSTAMGSHTTASGYQSTAMGNSTTASGNTSTAMGTNTMASGHSSTAMGSNTTASGQYSTAMGSNTTASGLYSIAMGGGTTASGDFSTAMGWRTTAPSYAETTLGYFSTDYTPFSATVANPADRLLVVGNGSSGAGSDALVLLKNGNMTISGSMTATAFVGDGSGLTNLPAAAVTGTISSAQISDGSIATVDLANASVTAAKISGITAADVGAVAKTGDVMSGALTIGGSTAGSKLNMTGGGIVNSTSALPVWNAGTGKYEPSVAGAIPAAGAGVRMMWYPEMAAFRAGYVAGTEWNNAKIGAFSVAMGKSTTASGNISTAMGWGTTASGDLSVSIGNHTTAKSYGEVVVGRYNRNYTMSATGATDWVLSDRLFTIGNGSPTGNSDAMVVMKSGDVGFGLTVKPSHPLQMASGAHVTAGGVWTNASSRALKDNIRTLKLKDAESALAKLEPVRYVYKNSRNEEYVGFIAEDVPDLVATNDRKSLAAMDIVAVLTKVVQDQRKMLAALKAENAKLASEQQKLAGKVEMLVRAMAGNALAMGDATVH